MHRWTLLTGAAVLGAVVWLRDTRHVRTVLTGPPPGDLAGPELSGTVSSGGPPADLALWALLAVAAAVLALGAVRSRAVPRW